MTLSRTLRRKEDANWTPKRDAHKGLLLGSALSPNPAQCVRPRARGILGRVVFGRAAALQVSSSKLPFALGTSWRRLLPIPRLLPLPFPLQKLGPRLPKTFYDVGYESVSAPGPLFGKVTWTSTAMAEGEEVLPLPTSGDEGWWVEAPGCFALPFFSALSPSCPSPRPRQAPAWNGKTRARSPEPCPAPSACRVPLCQHGPALGAKVRLGERGVSSRCWASVRLSSFIRRLPKHAGEGWLRGWVCPESLAWGVRVGCWLGRKFRRMQISGTGILFEEKTAWNDCRSLCLRVQRLSDTPRDDSLPRNWDIFSPSFHFSFRVPTVSTFRLLHTSFSFLLLCSQLDFRALDAT